MKQLNITIHPFSALAGMALLGLVWVTAGAMPLQGSSSTRDVNAIEDVNDVHPRDCVIIKLGQPYVVPAGRLLVITAFGYAPAPGAGYLELLVDGVVEFSQIGQVTGELRSMLPLPEPGLIVNQGQTVVSSPASAGIRAWGYLVDA